MENTGSLNPSSSTSDITQKVADAARPAVDRAAATAHQTVDSIAGAANEAVESMATRGAQLRQMQERLVNNCSSYVQENPLMAIGIALATGYLLSRLTSSR